MPGGIHGIALAGVGALVGIAVLAYGAYISLFPLLRTVEGGLTALAAWSASREEARQEAAVPVQLGLTLADGGEARPEDEGREKR